MSFLEQIFNARTNPIGETSRKLYKRNLEKLNGGDEVTDLKYLSDIKSVLKTIEKYAPTTQRTFIISICTVLRGSDDQDLYQEYFDILKQFNSKLSVNTEKSQKQKDNWISTDDIAKLRIGLQQKVSKKKVTNKIEFTTLLQYLVLSLYSLISPRRNLDFALMKVSSDMRNKEFNYLDLPNKRFVFNRYKTAGTYHEVAVDIPDDLMVVIKLYLRSHPFIVKTKNKSFNFSFLINFDGVSIDNSDKMTKLINKIFGRKISSSMLRNIFLSDKYSTVLKELKSDTADMGTSVGTAMNNYIKQDS